MRAGTTPCRAWSPSRYPFPVAFSSGVSSRARRRAPSGLHSSGQASRPQPHPNALARSPGLSPSRAGAVLAPSDALSAVRTRFRRECPARNLAGTELSAALPSAAVGRGTLPRNGSAAGTADPHQGMG